MVAGCTDDSQGGVGARAPARGRDAAPAVGTVANVGLLPEVAPPESTAAPSEPETSAPATTIADGSVPASAPPASTRAAPLEAEAAPAESTVPGSTGPDTGRASTPGTTVSAPSPPRLSPPGAAAGDSAPLASAPPGWPTASGSSAPLSLREQWERFAATAADDTFAGGASAAELVAGNRVIMIGDSITESTSLRYGGAACERIVPNGWAVEIDAQTGRFADYGLTVLDERLDAGFDVAVVMFGNNYRSDPVQFEGEMREIVTRLAPRPTILFTVTMYKPDRAEVNDIIYEIALDHPNIRVIDWAAETAARPDLLAGDRLHLSGAGRTRFVELLAGELGTGPNGRDDGACLPTP